MTNVQFNEKIAAALNTWVTRCMAKFYADVKEHGEKEARRIWREKYGLIFRRQYTVGARFVHYRAFPWDDLTEKAQKMLTRTKTRDLTAN